MPEILLVRQHGVEATEQDKNVARRILFGHIDGLGQRGQQQWRRFWGGLFSMEPGEIARVRTLRERSGPYHRRHMKIEQTLFESQERFTEFDPGFRDWLKVGSGFVTWYPGPKGGVFPVPRSIAWDEIEEDEMREVHDRMIRFVRSDHATRTLWPHLSQAQRIDMIETILRSFGE